MAKSSSKMSDTEMYPISVFVVTSHRDNDKVYDYIEQNKFFGIENLQICYQQDLTVIDNQGKLIRKDRVSILKCPNGTGGIFNTMNNYNLSKHQLPK